MALPPLYKYLDVEGAKLTLGNRTFRHAKPSDFNDTEDLTIQSIFPEELQTALKRASDGILDVILKHLNDPPTCASPMREKLAQIQALLRADPKLAEWMRAEIKNGGLDGAYDPAHMQAVAEATIADVNEFMQGWRVLCVTTHRDSEKMWSGYARNHTGIALRIEPNIEKDSKFQKFVPVVYQAKRPPLYDDTLEFVAGGLFGDRDARSMAMMNKIIYAKTLPWQHEGEYRLAIPIAPGEEPWNTLPYHPEEITELNLGAAMTDADKQDIVAKAKAVNAQIKVFQAKKDNEGRIIFDQS
ncbi:DUF2971 domain-containing protein [Bradyrhizobium sp. CCGUVB14]|uniref:DUF2971 domain-containing protein n=1 Tax=Bradyrhizobium sp. CCGUVB14 TaxID=2949628 RepID=UPI0020B1BB19|nr:DUF2971 domain-containing protein [Bradyrhizobium sp. CCGUVB14]MCP3447349.1 DUF2971 domain-containing protein [Bradyrhizobium sp. CCGUVB14]